MKKSIVVSRQHHSCYLSATWLQPIHHIKRRGGKSIFSFSSPLKGVQVELQPSGKALLVSAVLLRQQA